ncbi:hypothetical protein CYMTET_3095 [Cymbomonas tetramitiformis]|uniref:Uncharacterized protein n=1 Tax=Cymbomonas tetramitiformis TaxID=36881 RepID=A0AAE0H3Y2_9CHLO|nr:hypothetical protein CYMTET_3095 [Cymbomonas tetramitiformis]
MRGNVDPEIQHTQPMKAEKSQGVKTSAFAATAAVDTEDASPAADAEDADVNLEWTLTPSSKPMLDIAEMLSMGYSTDGLTDS